MHTPTLTLIAAPTQPSAPQPPTTSPNTNQSLAIVCPRCGSPFCPGKYGK